MFNFVPGPDCSTSERYSLLLEAAGAITLGEDDSIANMANVAALLGEFIPDCNWAGFYRVVQNELVLGPFVGRPACIRIPIGTGVCGTAAQSSATQLVKDVHAFPGHIACDGNTQSEVVVPVIRGGKVIAVIDLDSPTLERFTAEDAAGIEQLAALLSDRI